MSVSQLVAFDENMASNKIKFSHTLRFMITQNQYSIAGGRLSAVNQPLLSF